MEESSGYSLYLRHMERAQRHNKHHAWSRLEQARLRWVNTGGNRAGGHERKKCYLTVLVVGSWWEEFAQE